MRTSPRGVSSSLLVLLLALAVSPARAQSPEADIVEASGIVLDEIMALPITSIPTSLLANAQGVAIIPNMLKGGFVVGVRHGRGALLLRDANGLWQPPQFVSITGGSIGWQIGIQATDLVLVFKSQNSIRGLLRGKLTLGADAAAAAGPVGREATAATDAALRAEIYSYSRSRGLFAGVSLDGSVVQIDTLANTAFYGLATPPLVEQGRAMQLPQSAVQLLNRINRYSVPIDPNSAAQAGVAAAPAGPQPTLATPQPTLAAPTDLDAIRRQLGDSASRLHALLDDNWKRYLALPADLYSPDRKPTDDDLAATLRHYDMVAQTPQYQNLAGRPEFRTTHDLLRRYWSARQSAARPAISLPPPPASSTRR